MSEKLFNSEYLSDRRLPLRLIKRDPQEDYALHSHEFSELVIVYRGNGEHIIYGESRKIRAGDVFLISNNTRHGYRHGQDLALYNIMFDMREVSNPLQAFCRYPALNALFCLEPKPRSHQLLTLNPAELEQILAMLRQIEAEQSAGEEHFQLTMAAHFVLLAVLLARFCTARRLSESHRSSEEFSRILNLISEKPEHRWTRKEMARRASMSESTLTRMFKNATGCPPLEYLIILRLKKGAMLLVNTNASIGEIAGQAGFRDSNYFCRQFKKHFGTSPQKYRSLR